jgi:hypothetical protein
VIGLTTLQRRTPPTRQKYFKQNQKAMQNAGKYLQLAVAIVIGRVLRSKQNQTPKSDNNKK